MELLGERTSLWFELALATPVILWSGWPFFVRGLNSFRTMRLNMFSLISMGVGAAYIFSIVAVMAPQIFPDGFRDENGNVGVYFEAAAVIVTLVLLGQVLPKPHWLSAPMALRKKSSWSKYNWEITFACVPVIRFP